MNIEEFKLELKKIDIIPTNKQLEQLNKYYKLLVEENKKYNLTSITEEKEVYYKHFYDSILISKSVELDKNEILDIGSGAGFPGIVIGIFYPNTKITLIDSNNKKIKFLYLTKEQLGLSNINIIKERIEDYTRKKEGQFDIVTARAVAPLNILIELGVRSLKKEGYFIALKGIKGKEELEYSKKAIKELGLSIEDTLNIELPFNYGDRIIINLKKEQETNKKYPRNYNIIKKNPL